MNNTNRVPEIDGLRAIAVLLVLFVHARWEILWADTGGQIGVDIFFVVSGFVITQTMSREWARSGTLKLKKFYARRFIRLTPALTTMVLVTVPLGLLVFSNAELLLLNAFAALTYSYPIFMGLFGFPHLGYDHAWTLSLEEYFYLIFPILFIIARRFVSERFFRLGLLIASLLTLVSITVSVFFVDGDPSNRLFGLSSYLRVAGIGLGCWLGLEASNPNSALKKISGKVLNFAAPILLILALNLSQTPSLQGASWFLADLSSVCFLISIQRQLGRFSNRLLRSRFLVFIGGVSYELYLWHGILLKIAEEATNMSESVLALWVYPTCFLLAWVTKKAWEPLQIRLRKRLSS